MSLRYRISWVIFTACFFTLLLALPIKAQEDAWRVQDVSFKGFDNLSSKKALDVMEIQPPKGFGLRKGPIFDELALVRDQKRLTELYHEYGFFNAKINAAIKRDKVNHTVSILLTSHENKRALIRNIELSVIQDAQKQDWREKLLDKLSLKKNKPFLLKDYRKSKEKISEFLSDQAFPLNTVQGQVLISPDRQNADIILKVKLGPEVFFGSTQILGNKHVSEPIIRRDLAYEKGGPFSTSMLKKTQTRLLDTGFFNSVSLKPEYRKIQGKFVPVTLEVHERKAHSVRMGLGWGTEDNFRVRLSQVNRDPFNLGDMLTVEGKWSDIYEGMVGRWKVPQIFKREYHFGLSGGVEQKNDEAFRHRRYFITPILEYKSAEKFSYFLGYNMETDRVLELKTAVSDPNYENQPFFIASVPFGFKYDGRNSILNPTQGLFLRFDVETALKAFNSDLGFIRPTAEVSYILPFSWPKKWRFAARVEGGVVFSLLDNQRIPLVRRFFPGGADSVRGYPYQSLGPLDSAGKPLGGEAAFVSNWELRFPIWEELGGVLFIDAGNAWEDINEGMGDLRFTSGFGLRYETPVGPLRLDLGYQLNPPDGAHIPRYQAYLSVGQAF